MQYNLKNTDISRHFHEKPEKIAYDISIGNFEFLTCVFDIIWNFFPNLFYRQLAIDHDF